MTTPRAIEPSEIRVGDRVRMVQDRNGDQVTADMTVEGIAHENWLSSAGAGVWQLNLDGRTWTLLDRPEPPREPGSRWREDKAGGGEYILDEDGDYVWYRGKRAGAYCLSLQHHAEHHRPPGPAGRHPMTARRALPVGAVWLLLSLAGWGTVAAIGLIAWAVTHG